MASAELPCLTLESGREYLYTGDAEGLAEGLSGEEEAPLASRRGRRLWLLAAALSALALAAVLTRGLSGRPAPPARGDARAVEQKFYDEQGRYWQGPGRGVATSELWSSCRQPHLSTCGSFCCCDEGYYWRSPKSIYGQEEGALKEALAAGAKSGDLLRSPGAALEKGVVGAGKALAHAVVSSELAPGQKCIPKAEVPAGVRRGLERVTGGESILSSGGWLTCATFTPNSHVCGSACCCDKGYKWHAQREQCQKL